jgi:hypothetical protein
VKITTQEEEERWKISNQTISSVLSSTGPMHGGILKKEALVTSWKELLQTADGDIDFEGLEQEDFQTMLSEGSWRE